MSSPTLRLSVLCHITAVTSSIPAQQFLTLLGADYGKQTLAANMLAKRRIVT
jgi:hypothetical protein